MRRCHVRGLSARHAYRCSVYTQPLRRQLLPAEVTAIDDALDTASGILQEGGAATRRALLQSNVLTALTNPGAAFLWATSVEKSEGGIASVDAFADGIISSCSDIASVLFASATVSYTGL